ncbi:HEAT repeat domain-containing protein [Actinoplanes sp. HUAS TT8]|uniref:HEAT repeat domain-containing protein n=1 Tax=Actinoplanes sp. HUAS TT8 TaxID=3447453 RepID=UPI003F525997
MGLVRKQAAEPETPRALDPGALIRQLDDSDPERRREAALDLADVPDAVPELLARAGLESEPRVRDAVLTTLAGHDTEVVAAGLAVHLASDDAGLRTAVAESLATMPRSVPALLPSLVAAPDHDVRVMTAMVLADLADPAAHDWLIRMITEDDHPNVVTAAIDAFLPSATSDHVPVLQAAADRFPDDPFLQFTVRVSLPRLAGTA